LSKDEQTRLVENIVDHLKDATDFIQDRAIKNFSMVDSSFGQRLRDGVNKFKSSVKGKSANL
jgi:catalase